MNDIFISYAKEDKAQAKRIAEYLEDHGWTVWWDRSIPTGRTFDEVIDEAIKTSKCMIVLWTSSSVKSRWVKLEADEGVKKRLFPILLEEVEIPLSFRNIQAANLVGWNGDRTEFGFKSFIQDLGGFLGEPKKAVIETLVVPSTEKKIEPETESKTPSPSLDSSSSNGWIKKYAGLWIALASIIVVVLVFYMIRQTDDQ